MYPEAHFQPLRLIFKLHDKSKMTRSGRKTSAVVFIVALVSAAFMYRVMVSPKEKKRGRRGKKFVAKSVGKPQVEKSDPFRILDQPPLTQIESVATPYAEPVDIVSNLSEQSDPLRDSAGPVDIAYHLPEQSDPLHDSPEPLSTIVELVVRFLCQRMNPRPIFEYQPQRLMVLNEEASIVSLHTFPPRL
jgi:hypothetical protein